MQSARKTDACLCFDSPTWVSQAELLTIAARGPGRPFSMVALGDQRRLRDQRPVQAPPRLCIAARGELHCTLVRLSLSWCEASICLLSFFLLLPPSFSVCSRAYLARHEVRKPRLYTRQSWRDAVMSTGTNASAQVRSAIEDVAEQGVDLLLHRLRRP